MIDDWKCVGEWTAVERPEYKCELQEFRRGKDQMVFVHLHVRKWNKSALKQVAYDFKCLRKCITCPLYACGEVDDRKYAHFLSFFGFKFLTNALCTDGKQRRIFIHIKDDTKNVLKQPTNPVVPAVHHVAVVGATAVSDTSVSGRADGAGSSAASASTN